MNNMDRKPVLLILAAGKGSRYGGLKQLDSVGPNGESIMEYSIFDAIRGGFGRIVFVIDESFEDEFKQKIDSKYRKFIPIEYVFQQVDRIPKSFQQNFKRKKPWGTGHAVLMAKEKIKQPFAVINADDFYGQKAFKIMAEKLGSMSADSDDFYLLCYILANTLSENGSVSRGMCQVNNGKLVGITELTQVQTAENHVIAYDGADKVTIDIQTLVSMNFWGYSPRLFTVLDSQFNQFLELYLNSETEEFYLTQPIDFAIKNQLARINVLSTDEKWMGITYSDDKQIVESGIIKLIQQNIYPQNLLRGDSFLGKEI